MCNTTTPYEPPSVPPGQVFETYPEFLAAIAPGMRLCTSDSTGWGEVTGTTERSVLGTRDSDGAGVEVPPGGPPGHPGRALRPAGPGPGHHRSAGLGDLRPPLSRPSPSPAR